LFAMTMWHYVKILFPRLSIRVKMHIRNQKGFTLIEIITVLIILTFLIVVAIPRYFGLPEDAAESTLKSAVAELNAREKLAWAKKRVDKVDYDVPDIISDLRYFTVTGSDGNYQISSDEHSRKANVTRTPPSDEASGHWEITGFTD
jgi:prepilin-type N-terminal cleavage/methylation domain-containing protein